MKKLHVNIVLTLFLLSFSVASYAAAGPICAGLLGTADATSGQYVPAYTRWETDASGNVLITIYNPGEAADETKPTRWRGRGMADAVSKAKGWTLRINGEPVDDIANYFEKEYTSNGTQSNAPSVYKLKLKADVTVPVGSVIEFNKTDAAAANICWWTPLGNNAYGKYTFEYEYGSTCAGLSAPDNLAISEDNEVTFDDVTGADHYTIYCYDGSDLILSKTISSGDVLPPPCIERRNVRS